jgi:predicted TIM-barrel fold metal-dependent hydrolase
VLRLFLIFILSLLSLASAHSRETILPIIDMHLHAYPADAEGPPPVGICAPPEQHSVWDPGQPFPSVYRSWVKEPPCASPVWSPETDDEVMTQTIEVMERRNIVGVLSGSPERVKAWRAAAPHRFIAGLELPVGRGALSPDEVRILHEEGDLRVLAEVTSQYAGIPPDDERMESYWALAEELDIPVGIHIGPGPPGVIYLGATGYRARLHSALTLEEVLVRHPRLRVYVMHAGFPMLDDLLAVLYAHPQLYVEVGEIVFAEPRSAFYRYLRGVVEAGFGARVMYGTDQMVWPGVIERSIEAIEKAPFLSERQKRDILYNNAARFLRLSDEEIAQHRDR